MISAWKAVRTIARRELTSYFASPVAYVFLVIFLLLTGFFTFTAGGFFERGEASLVSFFAWHPWLYLILVPAVGMRVWAEERRSGTIELLLTLPVVYPAVIALGFDPIWFGIVVVKMCEICLLTPPIGLNCFVVNGVRPDIPLSDVFRGILPFFIADVVTLALFLAYPDIILWLPRTMHMS